MILKRHHMLWLRFGLVLIIIIFAYTAAETAYFIEVREHLDKIPANYKWPKIYASASGLLMFILALTFVKIKQQRHK